MTLETKNVCQSAEDIISSLPRDAIDNILTSLPLHDAGRTCILSQKWRYMWANLPYLVFDRETFTGTTKETEDKLVIAIQQALLLKRVPIMKFVLSLPGLKSSSHIDLLVAFLTRNSGLQELMLHLWEGDRQYKLPSSLFLCQELARLSLQDCVIEPLTPFKGFKKLVSLELYQCLILPDVLPGLISSCLLLEEVKVSSPIPIEGDIEISAPNLRKLSFTGDFPLIRVKDAPLLSSCVMCLPGGVVVETVKVTSVFFKSLCNLPAVQDLQLDFYYAGDESVYSDIIPRELTTSLNHLRSLTLWNISFGLVYEASTILCLIRSSPNLVKIVVDSYDSTVNSEDIIIKLLQVREMAGHLFL